MRNVMTPFSRTGRSVKRYLADRLDTLQQNLEHLGGRLREGIAAAIGQTVSDAAQVAVRTFLAGLQNAAMVPQANPYRPVETYPPDEPSYFDGWDHPDSFDRDVEFEAPAPPAPKAPRWQVAVTAAVQVLAHCLRQPFNGRSVVTAFAVAALTGAAALVGGPLGATGAAVVGTVLSLVAVTNGTRTWVSRFLRATATP
jgi:hypothetical protein